MLVVVLLPAISAAAIWFQLAVFGIGIGLFHAVNNADIMSAAPASKSSLAGSLLALVRYLGQIAGVCLATLLVGSMGAENAVAGSGFPGSEAYSFEVPIRVLFGTCFLLCLSIVLADKLLPRDRDLYKAPVRTK
jgi:hypothetical protein